MHSFLTPSIETLLNPGTFSQAMVPVFSGHTGVTNVELLIFFCGGRVQFQLYTGKHTLYYYLCG